MLNELYHSLDPVAFSAGPFTVYWYGLAYMVGALLAGVVMYRTLKRWDMAITIDDAMTLVVSVVFGLLIGGRLFYVLFYSNGYYFGHPLEIIFGSVSYTHLGHHHWCVHHPVIVRLVQHRGELGSVQ